MRIFVALALGSLLMVGCGDDNGGTGGGGNTAGTGGMGGGGSGLSVRVSWEPGSGCAQNVPSAWEITVAVTGEVGTPMVAGSVNNCNGDINMVGVNMISCPNFAPYNGTVTVTDTVGTDEVDFTIDNCMSGSAS